MKNIKIGNKNIGENHPCFIIAEAGSNHNGDFEMAKKLIDVAVEAKVDAVKFQFFKAEKIAANTPHEIAKFEGKSLIQFYKENEADYSWIPKLAEYCQKKGIIFLATPFDYEAANLLEEINIQAYKVASFEIVDIPFLKYLARKKKPMIISSGMADLEDIRDAINSAYNEENRNIAILHCGINYPVPFEEVNLRAMETIKNKFSVIVGYSDHTEGITVPVAAVARGAKIIEKHFTLNRDLNGPDHKFAINPEELKLMVKMIRQCEQSLGSFQKKRTESETIHYQRGRRSLFAARNINEGEILSKEDFDILRPGVGLKPKHIYSIIGRKAAKSLNQHNPVYWDILHQKPIAFLCFGGKKIGAGHIARSFKIAKALVVSGSFSKEQIHFLISGDSFVDSIIKKVTPFFNVTIIEDTPSSIEFEINKVNPVLLIVDRLTFDTTFLDVRKYKVISLDNYASGADTYINIRQSPFSHQGKELNSYQYWAIDYPLIRKNKEDIGDIKEIIITCGYTDPFDLTSKLIEYLTSYYQKKKNSFTNSSPQITCIITSLFKNGIKEKILSINPFIIIKENIENLLSEVTNADIAVVAGGNTMFESVAVGTPTLVVPNEQKNNDVAESLAQKEFLIKTNVFPISEEDFQERFGKIEKKEIRKKLNKNSLIFDGCGMQRIVKIVKQHVGDEL